MRLMHVMASAPEGGAEMIMLESVMALASEGFTQYVVTRPNSDWRLEQLAKAGIAYATTGLNPAIPALSRYKTKRVIQRFRPDVIQYWKARAGGFTFPKYASRSVAWHGGTARLKHLSGCDWHQGSGAGVVADFLQSGVEEGRAFLVPPFANMEDHAPLSRDDFDIAEGAVLAVVLSRLHAKKGLDTLLDAIKQVSGLHVLIAGDGPMRGAMEAQIKALNIDDRVQILGWRNDRCALLDMADMVICPSRIEPFGKTVLDAWAAGKPVIAADATGPANLITPGITGMLVKRGDDDALASAIAELMGSPALAGRMASAGRAAYDAEYGREIFLRQMKDLYEKVAAHAGPFKA